MPKSSEAPFPSELRSFKFVKVKFTLHVTLDTPRVPSAVHVKFILHISSLESHDTAFSETERFSVPM